MKAISKFLASGVGIAALASAAPAAAQYYPGTGYGYGYGGGDILSQIINSVLGGQRYGQGYGYGYNPQQQRYLVEQCARQTEYRIQRDYAGYSAGYGAYGGYNSYGGSPARIVSITRVEPRSNGGVKIWGTATSGRYSGYGSAYGGGYGGYGGYGQQNPYGASQYGYANTAMADLHFDCTIDYRGRVTDIDVDRNSSSYRGY